MSLPLEIAATPRAHGAKIYEVTNLLYKPSICGPVSDILGQDAFMETVVNLQRRLHLGECAAALAKYTDKYNDVDKPVGTIIYSQTPNSPNTMLLELIVTREKYRCRKVGTQLLQLVEDEARSRNTAQLQTQAPQKIPDLQCFLAKNGFYFSHLERSEGGVLFLRYKKDIAEG